MRTVASYAPMSIATQAVLALVPTEEERQIRDAVRGICDGFPADYSRAKHAEGLPPAELWDALAEKGYLGVNVPEEWGGGGVGMSMLAAVGEEITAAGKSLLLIVVSPAIVGSILARHGTDAQNERWLRGIAAGTVKVAFAITEPDAGTNSHNLSTSLDRRGDGFVLNGQKTYISGVEHADAVLVVARSRLPDGRLGLPSLAIVDVDAPGFTRDEIPMPYVGPDKQWTLFFDDVELEEERLIGGEGGGLGPVFDGLNPERIMGAAIACGMGRRALDKAAAYANERSVWNAPIGTHQGISHPLAEAKIELELARLMTQKAGALYDAGAPGTGEASNMAKYAAAEAAIKCVDRAIQTHGGNGFALEYGLSDMWWGARLTRTAPVSREMILNYVAEHSLGLPKSY
ncbi:MAG TPA: acyl-CoA dehydrogenase family protein [Thermoleophilaceae bacterium]|jgi:alkylation response protein AidB-like acyl-CoA dehydrogenase|nr:acyl-CoA dehydrogenase family protein [Thermoleophilaceae bacterium]